MVPTSIASSTDTYYNISKEIYNMSKETNNISQEIYKRDLSNRI